MSPLYLLDTTIVLALVRGSAMGQHVRATYQLDPPRLRPLVSIVTHGELFAIARHRGWGPEKREALATALDALVTVDLDVSDVVDAYVDVYDRGRRHRDGSRNMEQNDLWTAACAIAAGATLLTADMDFVHLHPTPLLVEYVDPR